MTREGRGVVEARRPFERFPWGLAPVLIVPGFQAIMLRELYLECMVL